MEFLETLDRCTALERQAGEIYALLEARFGDDEALRALWHRMATDEGEHARRLAGGRQAAAREVAHPPTVSGFTEAVDAVEALMRDAHARAVACRSPEDAFAIALDLETSELDGLSERLLRSSLLDDAAPSARTVVNIPAEHHSHHDALVRMVRARSHDDHNLLRAALLVATDDELASYPDAPTPHHGR